MTQVTRRMFVGAAAATLGTALIARVSHAQEIVSNDNVTALAMGYVADHTTVDTAVDTAVGSIEARISTVYTRKPNSNTLTLTR